MDDRLRQYFRGSDAERAVPESESPPEDEAQAPDIYTVEIGSSTFLVIVPHCLIPVSEIRDVQLTGPNGENVVTIHAQIKHTLKNNLADAFREFLETRRLW